MLTSLAKRRAKELFESPTTFGTSLVALLIDNFGTDCFEWEPQAIELGIHDAFDADTPQVNRDKYMGLILALTTDRFYNSWDAFLHICRSLNGHEADFRVLEAPDPEDLAWGVAEVLMNDPPEKNDPREFSPEVSNFTGVVLYDNGIWQPPKLLDFAEYPEKNPVMAFDTLMTEDPSTFEAAYKSQDIRRQELESFIKNKMQALVAELRSVPLEHRSASISDQREVDNKQTVHA